MSSFCLNNGFRLQKTNRAARRWKQPPKKPFHRVSRDKILHDSWSISAALARGFSDHHFERGEGPGDEVEYSRALNASYTFQLLMGFWCTIIKLIAEKNVVLSGCQCFFLILILVVNHRKRVTLVIKWFSSIVLCFILCHVLIFWCQKLSE